MAAVSVAAVAARRHKHNNPNQEELTMTAINRVPDVVFKTRVRDESVEGENPFRWEDKTTQDLFGGKKVQVRR